MGFSDIRLGAPILSLPIKCLEPSVCENAYDSVWVRIWHSDGVVREVDVIYSGKTKSGKAIKSGPITLAQAIRSHSIRWGGRAPRLGYGGNANGVRVIVDFVNGIAYLADGARETSLVKEVRYLPVDDPLIRTASASVLSEHGKWLIQAAWATRRYKNLAAEGESSPGGDKISRADTAQRLRTMSSDMRVFAKATLMLSGQVRESLGKNEQPDPEVASKLRKAFSMLTATTDAALGLLKDHADEVAPEDADALPLDLAGQAGSRMKLLVEEGFAP